MPFVRHARDKRGYESTYVMHAYRSGHGPARTKVLYVFRSPSGLRTGRRALDAEVLDALERMHPDLNFDWPVLLRESTTQDESAAGRPRPPRPPRAPARREPQPAQAEPPVVMEDESLLGRTLGAREATRLRTRYTELVERIGRRARTPEDRHRLTERAARLNPDEWPDAAAIKEGAGPVEAEWAAIAAELPSRRRGWRARAAAARAGSAIIAADDDNSSPQMGAPGAPAPDADGSGDVGGARADRGAEASGSGDAGSDPEPAGASPSGADASLTDPGLPGER